MTTNGAIPRSVGARHPRLKAASGRRLQGRKRERDDAAPSSIDGDSDHVAEAMSRIGSTIAGKWHLDVLLGVGGMAAVYAATHRNGNRVAIKLLHPVMGYSRALRERFLREGYAANRVDHDGAVRVLDDDELEDGTSFLVMELLAGETLETRWMRSGQCLPLADVLSVADELLNVLAAAHEKGIHHRDIKPENVFLTRAGGLKVLDFGIARVRETLPGSATATRTGVALGTPAFMPPEQALGKSREIDGRCDLWAVGATMFTLLAGRFVHVTDSPSEMLVKAATERAPAFATVMPHIPAQVAAIIDRALTFERDGRFPDATTMRRLVQKARADLGYLRGTVITGDAMEEEDSLPPGERPTLLPESIAPLSATAPVAISADATPPPSTTAPAAAKPRSRGRALALFLLGAATVAALLVTPAIRARRQPPASPVTSAVIAVAPHPAMPAPVVDEPPPPVMTKVAEPPAAAPPASVAPPVETPKTKAQRTIAARKPASGRPLSVFDHKHLAADDAARRARDGPRCPVRSRERDTSRARARHRAIPARHPCHCGRIHTRHDGCERAGHSARLGADPSTDRPP